MAGGAAAPDRLPSRRRFLAAASAAPFALWSGCTAGAAPPVVVVGGGLTGLVVARELERRGRAALVLEARPRLGGRVLTLREGLSAGLRGEAGAEHVAPEHLRVRQLAHELGVGFVPPPPASVPFAVEIDGRWYRISKVEELPRSLFEGLTPFELAAAPFELHLAYLDAAAPPAADDPRSGLAWLRDQGLSERGEQLLRGFCYHPFAEMSAAELWAAAQRERQGWKAELVEGGTDRLVAGVAAQLRAPIRRATSVVGVRSDGDRVRVVLADGSVVYGSSCVVCLPIRNLRALQLDGELARQVAAHTGGLLEAREVKCHAEVDERALSDGRVTASRYAAGPPRRVTWRMPERAAGHCVLTTIGFGVSLGDLRAAVAASASGAPAPEDHDFGADPLAGCAYVVARPGHVRQAGCLRAGRVVVAGSDLSLAPGWMDGAIASAHEAVEHLLRG